MTRGNDIEGGGGLIKDDQFGITGEGRGYYNPLFLATGCLMRIAIHHLSRFRDSGSGQQGFTFGQRLLGRQSPVSDQDLGDLIAEADHGVQRGARVLEHHADSPAPYFENLLVGFAPKVFAQKRNRARYLRGIVGKVTHDRPSQRGFARARLTDQPQCLAAIDLQVD